ncbi:MAG: DUF2085 domain-containing protein [Chloroflexi bacterium]|nr:MAG: DUF2085 domain-containing protein [Chloroflexota bacterium]
MSIHTDTNVQKMPNVPPQSAVWTERINRWVERHWLLAFNSAWGLLVTLPFLAPVFIASGLTLPGIIIYRIYSFLCHQLPERSWFLFGPQFSYTQEQIAAAWGATPAQISNELIRRQFIGTAELGWKVAWSDRMVAMYGSIFLFGLLFALLRQQGVRFKSLSWKWLIVLILPLAIDGTTHLVNDILQLDFRDMNTWAVWLTGGIFPATFYAGDMLGSLNSLLRIGTGLLFGFGIVAFLWPMMDAEFSPRK